MLFAPLALSICVITPTPGPPSASSGDEGVPRPNVLLILTDDQGWGDIGSHGNDVLDTPHLDRLAERGARFERFFVSPVCAPTRAALLTGRYSLRGGVHGVTRGHETMRSDEVTIAELLRDDGYATGCFGKWHNGAHWPEDPAGQGFGRFVGFRGGHWNNYFDPLLPDPPPHGPTRDSPAGLRSDGYIADVFTDAAARFIGEHHGDRTPWLAFVAYNTPHWPPQVPGELFEKYTARGCDAKTAAAYGMVENIDRNVGRLLAALEAWGVADDTVVIFLSDNGPNSDRYNGDLRGRKGSAHEGGVRVPCFVRYPRRVMPGTVVRRNAAHVDLLPTLCDLCGVAPPGDRVLDGKSLVPLLSGDPAGDAWPDRRLFTFKDWRGDPTGERGAVRTDRWRLVREGGRWELYDLAADPGETTDVADDHPAVRDELAAAFRAKWEEVTAAGFEPIPVTLVPDGDAPRVVTLPAHEATLHRGGTGGIRYHGPDGWANDWVEGWTDRAAGMVWPVTVGPGVGRVEAALLYAATPGQTGHAFTLGLRDGGMREVAVTRATVTTPHAPPPLPSPDRFPRGESPEKVWAVLPLGDLTPPAVEAGRLELGSIAPGGFEMPQVKAVRLTVHPADGE